MISGTMGNLNSNECFSRPNQSTDQVRKFIDLTQEEPSELETEEMKRNHVDKIEKNKALVNYGVFTSTVNLEALEFVESKKK